MLPAIDCEPYSFSPNAAHELDVLNHEPGSTRGAKILVIDDDRDLCLGLRMASAKL